MPHPDRAVPLRLIPRTGRRERSLRGAQPPMVTPLHTRPRASRLGAARRGDAFMAAAHKSMRVIAGSRDGFAV